MRKLCLMVFLALPGSTAFCQPSTPAPSFEVASVKPSGHAVGPDYNNQLTWSPNGLSARNATLKRLIAEAWRLQLNQVSCPAWLARNEYDLEAKTGAAATREQMTLMLQTLLAQRFKLVEHNETKDMRVYELVIGKSGPKIHAIKDGEAAPAQPGFHFHGDMRQFADLLAVQLSIPAPQDPTQPVVASESPAPVLDETGLPGIFDFTVEMRPELGTDMFASWQRVLQDQLGLNIESRKGNVALVVVDSAEKIPTEN